jgi:two-component system response regulator
MENSQVEILLIEDNPNDAEMTIRALQRNHISNKVIHLKDGAQGIDFIFGTGEYEGRDLTQKPKVILLDLKMPKVDGIEVLRKLKSDSRTKTIPVVVMTSSREDPDVRACYELGVNSYIVKPVNFDNFSKAIADFGLYWLLLNHSVK